MKKMLSMNKWWFIAAYVLGVLACIVYVFSVEHGEAEGSANTMLMVASHGLLIGALALAPKAAHTRYIARTFALYIFIVGAMLMVCPPVMGMVGTFAAYVVVGYLHTRVIDLTPYLHVLDPKAKEGKSDKYALWVMICVVSLILFYWQCNFV
ncbi:MAG: hypothetical protein IJS26_01355 [Alphaproteobacteria bacterium]|nr:hypothetical protein [Alphaproteobacteria bacterium]